MRALRWAPRQWLLGAALAATMLVGGGYWTAGLQRMPPEVAEMARRARDDVPEHMKRCHFTLRSDVRALMPPRCDSAPGEPPRLALWGDSHAEAWQPAAWEIARARGVSATAITMGSCTPMIGSAGRRSDIAGFAANCARLNELALARLREGGIDLLMIASRWPAPYPGRDGVVPDAAARTAGRLTPAELEASLDRVLSELRAVPRILLMLPIPELRHDAARSKSARE